MITLDEAAKQPEVTFSSRNLATAQEGAEKTDPLQGAEELSEAFFTPDEMGNLQLAAGKMAEYVKATNKVVYLKLSGGNLIVSAAISPDQAVQNFRKSAVERRRESLGIFWTAAVENYTTLEKRITALTVQQRVELLNKFNQQKESMKNFGAIEPFIVSPTLDLAMNLAGEIFGLNEAAQLNSLVEKITALLPQE